MKILVAHVPAGAGHLKAAEAVCATLQRIRPDASVELFDALEGVDAAYRWTYTDGYLDMINRKAALWGAAYHLTDFKPLRRFSRKVHRFFNAWHGKQLEAILIERNPDVIVGTHFFPMEVAGFLKTQGRLRARLISIVTDYLPHSVWIAPAMDLYVAGSSHTQRDLVKRGIPEEKIRTLGIPLHPKFNRGVDRAKLQKQLGLDPHRFTVLIGSGGTGSGPVVELACALAKGSEPIQILVVTGKNARLVQRLESARKQLSNPIKIFGFVDNVDELMAVSDVMVTKPGGLTCAEATAKGLPLILVLSIPGQETRNATVLRLEGAALATRDAQAVPQMIHQLQRSPHHMHTLKQKAQAFSRPDAAEQIARLALK